MVDTRGHHWAQRLLIGGRTHTKTWGAEGNFQLRGHGDRGGEKLV